MNRIRWGADASLRLGGMTLTFDLSWLVIIPLSLWAVVTIYVPIMGSFLSGLDLWLVALISALLCGVSLAAHALAHGVVARGLNRNSASEMPLTVPLFPLGDAAQVWPAAPTAAREAIVAMSGPLASALLAAFFYGLWNLQLHPYANVGLPLVVFYNGALAGINLIPAFPLDGGRLLRSIGCGLMQRPAAATRWALKLGFLFAVLLALWALYLLLQPAQGAALTGLITLLFAGLLLLGLLRAAAWPWPESKPESGASEKRSFVGIALAWLLIALLLIFTVSLVPTLGGIEIPGVAPSVAPMVEMPAEYRHEFPGKFILTTVLLQTPVTVGEWVFAHLSPVVNLVPPEQIVPPDSSAQEVARQQYKMLEESEATAVAVGLKLAGYEASVKGNGVEVVAILPESPSQALLQAGDVITGVNDALIGTTSELTNYLATQAPGATVQAHLLRDGQLLDVALPLMAPAEAGGPPRIGIAIQSAGFEANLPFPVKIVPQKIVGGPSAGLMFTLTVYNLLTPGDLTGGHTIAGTGTIDPNGAVGPIGGVGQKVVGAELAGAEYFLSPAENYADALAAAHTIHVVQVATAEEAIHFLQSLPPIAGQE